METTKIICLALLCVSLATCAFWLTYSICTTLAVADQAIIRNTVAIEKTTNQVRLLILDTKRKYIMDQRFADEARQTLQQTSAVIVESQQVVKNLGGLVESLNTTMVSTNELIVNTDMALNGEDGVLTELQNVLYTLNNRTLVSIEGEVVGMLDSVTQNMDLIAADVRNLVGDKNMQNDIKATVSQFHIAMRDGVTPITINLAEITGSTKKVAAEYERRLLRPSRWDRVRQVFNTGAFVLGDVVTPWLIANRVQKVVVID